MSITRRTFVAGSLAAGLLSATGPGALAGPAHVLRRAIPSSGEELPIIGLGTNRYGVDASEAARAPLKKALARFHEWGGKVVDTAPMYRTSESVLGDLISEQGIRDDLFIATKTDKPNRDESDAQMHDSLRKLKTDMFDLMQVHNLVGWRDSIPLIKEWKKDGRVRYVGITTSRARQYEEMEMIMKQHDLDFIQINYSIEQRESAERLLPLAADRGMAVILNRTFGGGRIFGRLGDAALPDWARDYEITSWAQFLLKYALSHPAVTLAIPGMTKTRHVDDNFGAAHEPMPDAAARREMEKYYESLG